MHFVFSLVFPPLKAASSPHCCPAQACEVGMGRPSRSAPQGSVPGAGAAASPGPGPSRGPHRCTAPGFPRGPCAPWVSGSSSPLTGVGAGRPLWDTLGILVVPRREAVPREHFALRESCKHPCKDAGAGRMPAAPAEGMHSRATLMEPLLKWQCSIFLIDYLFIFFLLQEQFSDWLKIK